MKNKSFYILLSLFLSIRCFASEQYCASVYIEKYDANQHIIYYYDDLGNRVLEIKQVQQGGQFVNKEYIECIYSGNFLMSEIKRTFQSGDYVNVQKIDYEYLNDNCIKKTLNIWQDNQWKSFQSESYTYNAENILISTVYQSYEDSKWVNKTKTEKIITNSVLTQTNFYTWNVDQWLYIRKIDFTYNSENLLILSNSSILENQSWTNEINIKYYYKNSQLEVEEYQEWDSNSSVWKKKTRFEYLYDESNKLTSQLNLIWNVCFWQNNMRIDYQYDNQNNIIAKNYYSWIYKMLLPTYSEEYIFDENNNPIEAKSNELFWGENSANYYTKHLFIIQGNNNKSEAYYGNKIQLVYKSLSEVQDTTESLEPENTDFEIFPNPSSDGFYYINTQKISIKSWIVYNLQGKLIKSFNNEANGYNSGVINIQEYDNGLYLLKLITDKGTFIKKLIRN